MLKISFIYCNIAIFQWQIENFKILLCEKISRFKKSTKVQFFSGIKNHNCKWSLPEEYAADALSIGSRGGRRLRSKSLQCDKIQKHSHSARKCRKCLKSFFGRFHFIYVFSVDFILASKTKQVLFEFTFTIIFESVHSGKKKT